MYLWKKETPGSKQSLSPTFRTWPTLRRYMISVKYEQLSYCMPICQNIYSELTGSKNENIQVILSEIQEIDQNVHQVPQDLPQSFCFRDEDAMTV